MVISIQGFVASKPSTYDSLQTRFGFLRPECVFINIISDTNCKRMDTRSRPDACNQMCHGMHMVIKRTGTLRERFKISLDLLERIVNINDEGSFFFKIASGSAVLDKFPHHHYDHGRNENYRGGYADRDSGKALFTAGQGKYGSNDCGDPNKNRGSTSPCAGGALVAAPVRHEYIQTANRSHLQAFMTTTR